MAKVYIELDYEVVEQAIKAKVPAAVEDVLRRYDLQRLIEEAITSDKKEKRSVSYSPILYGEYEPPSPRERFEAALDEAVNKALAAEAEKCLRDMPELLHDAMMRALPKALANLRLSVKDEDDE